MTKYDTWDSYFLPEPSHPEKERALCNLLGATTASQLAEQERRVTLAKVGELERAPIPGNFDFEHHRAIHKYIFGDVYETSSAGSEHATPEASSPTAPQETCAPTCGHWASSLPG